MHISSVRFAQLLGSGCQRMCARLLESTTFGGEGQVSDARPMEQHQVHGLSTARPP